MFKSDLPCVLLQELQRQKAEYENKKKIAEQLRIQQEEEEKEQRRQAAQRLQDKHKEQVSGNTEITYLVSSSDFQ